MRHVINVIMNRSRHPRWWGHDPISVCMEPCQFSCRNPGDPNRTKLLHVTQADPEFRTAVDLAYQAIAGTLADVTDDADSYFARSMPDPPAWARRAQAVYSDDWHAFFRLQNPAPGSVTKEKPEGEPAAPNVSIHALTADELNAEVLAGTISESDS